MSQKSNIRRISSLLLFAIFIFLKMGIAHSLSHEFSHDDVAECEDCFFILDANEKHHFNYVTEGYEEVTSSVLAAHKPVILLYANPVIAVYHHTQLFNRPPPSLVLI